MGGILIALEAECGNAQCRLRVKSYDVLEVLVLLWREQAST